MGTATRTSPPAIAWPPKNQVSRLPRLAPISTCCGSAGWASAAAAAQPHIRNTATIFRALPISSSHRIMRRRPTARLMDDDRSERQGAQELAPLVYDELRRLAGAYIRRERPGQTLQATALVHEAYLRLAGAGTPWHDKRHFVGIAARSMRQILVERARARGAQKRWGGMNRVSLTDALAVASDPESVLPPLDDALNRLEQIDPEQARIVELRFFAGLSIEDAAEALNMSPATLKRRWALARAWLFRELREPVE